MNDENQSASNASFFVDERVAAPEKKKEERKVTVPTVSNQAVAPNTDLLTEAKKAVAAPIDPVQVAQQAASANVAMPNPVTSSMKNVTGGINDFLSTTTLKDVAPYLLGAGGYALGKHLLNLRGEAGQAVTPPQPAPTQPAPTQAATAQPAEPQPPVNQQPPTTQPPVANTQQSPEPIVFDQTPEVLSDEKLVQSFNERLIKEHMEGVKEELGKEEVPAGNPKVTAGEVGSLVESEKNAAANQQAAYSKANPKPPGEERWLAGQWQSKKNPERAKTLIEGLKSSLPEGEKLQFPVNSETGKPMGGMPSREHVINFTNDLLGTKMSSEEFKDFKITPEHLDKMHEELTKRLESAKTPEAIAKAQKGFSTLGMLAGMAGVGLASIGGYSAYQHGKKTGDWSDLGQMAMDTGAGLIKGLRGAAAVPYAFATHTGSLNSNESEELAKRAKMPPTISRK